MTYQFYPCSVGDKPDVVLCKAVACNHRRSCAAKGRSLKVSEVTRLRRIAEIERDQGASVRLGAVQWAKSS